MRALRIFSALLLLAGAILITRAAYMGAKAELAAILIRSAWKQSLQSGKAVAPWPWADTHPVARLRIAGLKYDEIVLEGATPRTLAFGPAHLLNSASFGQPGNIVVAGHRTSWFRPLENISTGDSIQLEWFDSRGGFHHRAYEVAMIRVIDPKDTTLLAPTGHDALTLITCYPFGLGPGSPERFIVRALPTEPTRQAEAFAGKTPSRLYEN
jgi:sortase A